MLSATARFRTHFSYIDFELFNKDFRFAHQLPGPTLALTTLSVRS
jgi:hypothetical protein